MYHILMSAYACEPGAGSEYGVGWMVPTTMARKYPEHQFYVLTRSRWRVILRWQICISCFMTSLLGCSIRMR